MPHTMLRFPTVKARTGLSRSTIYLRISRGTFPSPVSLGGRAVGWIEAEVHAWLTARIAQRRLVAPGERGSSHDPSQEGGPLMTPRHTAPVAHGGVRGLAHGRGRGRPVAEQTAGAPRSERRTGTGRGDVGGVQPIRLPPKSPNLNAYAERFVRSMKEECLSRVVPLGEGHVRLLVGEDVDHSHRERNHQGLDNQLLQQRHRR